MSATTTEGNLFELALTLLKELDETDNLRRQASLQAQIEDVAQHLGELGGYALKTVEGDMLIMCLDQDQARVLQSKLLVADNGIVTTVTPAFGDITDFIHPQTDLSRVIEALTN